jgi:RNA polymerase sigma-70 factor (ECF subfamily)
MVYGDNGKASYESIMRRYNHRLFRVARAIVKSDEDAEDAVQNAYIQAYVHLDQFEGEAAFSTWLTRITPSDDDPERDLLRFEMRTLIEEATSRLRLKYRLVFMLRDVQELSTAKTARCLNISEKET